MFLCSVPEGMPEARGCSRAAPAPLGHARAAPRASVSSSQSPNIHIIVMQLKRNLQVTGNDLQDTRHYISEVSCVP